ncbi:hypothetical protein [Leptolyngbya iicbica]|uniref:hypothetical protein n=1 Tax=Leptolyngbya iicbica TaxID=3161580 RepID=UPI001028E990|nr:hypothetical protein [Leptolyngbya sp. LK]
MPSKSGPGRPTFNLHVIGGVGVGLSDRDRFPSVDMLTVRLTPIAAKTTAQRYGKNGNSLKPTIAATA